MVNREALEKARALMSIEGETELERVDHVRLAVWQLIRALETVTVEDVATALEWRRRMAR